MTPKPHFLPSVILSSFLRSWHSLGMPNEWRPSRAVTCLGNTNTFVCLCAQAFDSNDSQTVEGVLVEKLVCQITDTLHNSYMALGLVRGCFVVTSKRQATVRTCLQQLWLHTQLQASLHVISSLCNFFLLSTVLSTKNGNG